MSINRDPKVSYFYTFYVLVVTLTGTSSCLTLVGASMAETQAVITVLKQALRQRNVTYADVAAGLSMSEANVKRMFAAERMTLNRIEDICRLVSLDLSSLFQLYDESLHKIQQLTEDQEKQLVADTKLLLVAVCVRNDLNFEEILANHHISESELIRCLAKLDRLKVIDLLPRNKIKLRIDENFNWIDNGPIESFYKKTIQNEFLDGKFDSGGRQFLFGLFSDNSKLILQKRLQTLAHEFIQLHRQDRQLPFDQRSSVGLLVATRDWEFSILAPYVKS